MKLLKGLVLASMAGVSGCNDTGVSGDAPKPEPATQTNADYVLEELKNNNTAGIVLHLKPRVKMSCKYMYAEISHKTGDDEPWQSVAAIWPGKKARETYGERFIENQLQFLSLKTQGEHAVTAFGCAASASDNPRVIRGMFGKFTPEPGALLYIGELGPWDGRTRFMALDIVDRSDMVQEKVSSINPGLTPYFKTGLMKTLEETFTPEQKARLDGFQSRAKKLQTKLTLRDDVVREHNKVVNSLNTLDAVSGGLSDEVLSPEGQAERDSLRLKGSLGRELIDELDEMIKADMPLSRFEARLSLLKAKQKADETYSIYKRGKSVSEILNDTSPRRDQLYEALKAADRKLEAFDKNGSLPTARKLTPAQAERAKRVQALKAAERALRKDQKAKSSGVPGGYDYSRSRFYVAEKAADFALHRHDRRQEWQKAGRDAGFIHQAMTLMKAADEAQLAHDYHVVEHGKDIPKEMYAERNALVKAVRETSQAYESFVQ